MNFKIPISIITCFLLIQVDFSEPCISLCVNCRWNTENIPKLERDLDNFLHGQHLVKEIVLKYLKHHTGEEHPRKALVLSFNGLTGTGKNFVSIMIAKTFFINGMKSNYVHVFDGKAHFPLEKKLDEYKESLQKKIIGVIEQSPCNLFIFDEVHNMPGNLLDVIKPFADVHESIYGVDPRKSIFLLLSNSGGIDINNKLIETYKNGKSRESLTLKDFEDVLIKPIYNMKKDGLRKADLIKHGLITAFVPFLPLEKHHVELCIRSLMKKIHNYEHQHIIKEVLETIEFKRIGSLEYASQGCKKVEDKLILRL